MLTKYTWIMDAISNKSKSEGKASSVARMNADEAIAALDKHPTRMIYEVHFPDGLYQDEKVDALCKFVEFIHKEGLTIQFLDTNRFILYNKDFLA